MVSLPIYSWFSAASFFATLGLARAARDTVHELLSPQVECAEQNGELTRVRVALPAA